MKLMIILWMLFVTACTVSPTAPPPSPSPGSVVSVVPSPTPTVVPGSSTCTPGPNNWCPELDVIVKAAVTSTMLSEASTATYCPKWAKMSEVQKRQFFADLLWADAAFESGSSRDPLAMYWEKSMTTKDPKTGAVTAKLDDVTGQRVISEGLLQLSYQDEVWAHCGFDYAKDKNAHLDDLAQEPKNADGTYKQSFRSHHPEKTILNAALNLKCGVKILDWRVKKYPGRDFQENMGKYWASIRDQSPAIKKLIKARRNDCGY